ncbi:cubilin-like [Daphnia pulex]|uniref:cubilin-like n=1 Tax=Daphnia pulex TaxID=6669 RepID=UPI001EDEC107|nr:cubilin-like [Daphnia pulex]XP_046452996.1 cubilin-like [Daphnia pulex]
METLGGAWIYVLEPENCLAGTTKISFKFGLLSKGYCSLSLNRLVQLHSIGHGRSTLDVEEWRNKSENSHTGYGERGHSVSSRFVDPRFEWGRSAHADPFRSFKAQTYPVNKKEKYYSSQSPPKSSHRPISNQNIPPFGYPISSNFPQFSCNNVIIPSLLFYLKSPFYPQPYRENTFCRYVIKKAFNVCSLELDFRDFYLEPTVDCSKDWLLIGDRKYCGFHRPRKVIISLNYLHKDQDFVIEFRSDSFLQFHGFYIVGRQLPCQPIPPQIRYVANPPIPPLRTHVTPPFPRPAHPTGPSGPLLPPTDVVKRPKIETPLTPLLNKVPSIPNTPRPHPPYPPPTYPPQPPIIPPVPTFTPTSTTPSSTLCDLTLTTPQGQFQSTNYPENYGPNLSCELRFVPPNKSFCVLELHFQDFYLEESKGCFKDALIIGGNRYCGTSLTDQRLRITFVSGSSISLQFVTDSNGSFRGFDGRYRMMACEEFSTTEPPNTTPPGVTCDRVFSELENTVTSVNYPLPYLKNLDCIYTVVKLSPVIEQLLISFIAFDLQNSTDCSNDYLEISAERYCGVQTGLVLRVPFVGADPFEIRFHSDGAVQQTGFKLSVVQIDRQVKTAPPAPSTSPSSYLCQTKIFSESSFLIISPQFPLLYLPGQDCNYNVIRRSQDVCGLQLKFIFFSLPGTINTICEEDYLEIENYRFCGDLSGQTSRKIPFLSSQVSIVFHSDSVDNEAQGFSIQVVQLTDCTTTVTEITALPIRVEDSSCKIPLLPNEVVNSTEIESRQNQECVYIINQEEDACGVQLHFKEFYITPSINCSENYIEVDNRHFCGQQLNNMKIDVRFHVDGQPIYLPFRITQQQKFLWNLSTSSISCEKIQRKQCSSTIWSSESTFKYSALSSSERTECDFVIRRWSRRMCGLQLEFFHFDITDETNCESNYLDVGGKQLCGNMTGRKTSYEFSPSEEMVSLKLVHTNNVDLEIRVNQIQCR